MANQPLIEMDPRALRRLRDEYRDLSDRSFGKALQKGVNDCLDIATTKMQRVFETEIEGGPTRWTQVQPGQKKGSVVAKKGFFAANANGEVEGRIFVMPNQSRYLKYMLGEARLRRPGDVGIAEKYNFIPMDDESDDLEDQGIKITQHGNMPRNSLRKFVRRVSAPPPAPGARKRRKRYKDIFFGRLGSRANPKGPLGFRQRPDPMPGIRQRNTLLILAAKASRYPKDYLVPGWNRAVRLAADELPRLVSGHLATERQRASGGSSSGTP